MTDDGDATLLAFFKSTYEAATDLGRRDRDKLGCATWLPAIVRPSDSVSVLQKAPLPDERIQREDGPSKGRGHILVHSVEAEMTYSRASETLVIIDHTDVPEALRGRRVGERTIRQAVNAARREGFAIVPLCPFAKAQNDRNPELQDVLHRSTGIAKDAKTR